MRAIDDVHDMSSTPGGVLLLPVLAAWNQSRFFGFWLVRLAGASRGRGRQTSGKRTFTCSASVSPTQAETSCAAVPMD